MAMLPPPVRRPPGEQGLALLLVLLLSLILLPFATEFAIQVEYESRTAVNVTDQLKIANAIDGQFEIMLSRLKHDAATNEVDIGSDDWNAEELRDRKDDASGVAITTRIADEQSKLNLRGLAEGNDDRRRIVKARLVQLLVEFRRDTPWELGPGEAEEWANRIAEYVAKGPVRANIPTPRMADDRPMLVLEELTMIPDSRGEGFGTILHDRREGDKVAAGLHRYVTLYGTGKLNLNTADAVLLRAVFRTNPELADRIIERRDSPPEEQPGSRRASDTAPPTENPYTDVNQISEVEGVTAKSLQDNEVNPALDFDVASNFFSFRIIGETDATRLDDLFVVERVRGQGEGQPLEGFRILLRQERTDALEELTATE